MSEISIKKDIERLLKFALNNELIEEVDKIPSRNALMELLKIDQPFEGEIIDEDIDNPSIILNSILDYAAKVEIIPYNTTTFRDLLDAKIMGLLMPRQSEVVSKFVKITKEKGIKDATKYFYKMSKASNYIRMDRTSKNSYWVANTEYGPLEITINLSKPEKDPKDITAAKAIAQSNYPKCLLCLQNIGYSGRINHPARQNHRVIPVKVAQENWYLQYSPYVYYNEHCILFHENHVPMKICENTFVRLLDFVQRFPHYFIGSNADLPIVGGSILTHEHFQGGRHLFPMEKASIEKSFKHSRYINVDCGIVKWPLSVIRLSSESQENLIDLSIEVLKNWKKYSDEELDILAYTENENTEIPHNTVTPIVRKNKRGEFEIDIVLRNNRTTSQYPYGIFHPHEELHHIKKENIGLIEVMGLAVLPARLEVELRKILDVLTGKLDYNKKSCAEENDLSKHADWIEYLLYKYGRKCNVNEAKECIEQEVGRKFLQVLLDAGVFKKDNKGKEGFIKFMNSIGFEDK